MNKNILIVDDSATLRAAVTSSLSQVGYKVYETTNGREGLEWLDQARENNIAVHMIISDINMPVMDGLEFIKTVKEGPDRFIPILVMTTENEDHMKEKGRQAGAAGWLVKPFLPPVLIKVVRKFVR